PNGSEYIIRLGNKNVDSEADRISYSFDVPSNVESYAIVFNYAIVFQEIDPPHLPWQQPKFTVVLIDEDTNTQDECASFEYTSQSGIPGFSRAENGAFFKPWASVMVNLTKYIGHRVRLEFTTNDCSENGHFGYAYIDLNENCAIPVNGNVTCPENNSVTLRALPDFATYRWYNPDTKVTYGTLDSLYLFPTPPIGTRIAVELVPYLFAGGCTDTLYTVIKNMGDIKIRSPLINCLSIDLTSPSIVGGNKSGITYSYWKDPRAHVPLANPKNVRTSGTYYIMGRLLPSGCFSIMPVVVNITAPAPIAVNPPDPVNYPGTIDLTKTFAPRPGVQYT
ncbi:MAG TPA: hypothetical protein DIT07_04330, partial [Sphingobacteriaceae bacterium]|nr:hypothetical protein [Sphingobacteriaceae bacterium]